MWGWGLWTDRVLSLSLGLAQRTPNDNNNNTFIFFFLSWVGCMGLESSD